MQHNELGEVGNYEHDFELNTNITTSNKAKNVIKLKMLSWYNITAAQRAVSVRV